jgi:hypothetical protein
MFMHAIRILAATLGIALSTQGLHAQAQPFNNRKTSAKATIAGSHGTYDGTFVASNVSNICGEVPAMMNFSGQASFIVEYPRDPRDADQIQSISFGSTKLTGKATTASAFLLNISVLAKNGGRPYAYVLNTQDNPKVCGVATLIRNMDRSVVLSVRGKNEAGETIQLSITCI